MHCNHPHRIGNPQHHIQREEQMQPASHLIIPGMCGIPHDGELTLPLTHYFLASSSGTKDAKSRQREMVFSCPNSSSLQSSNTNAIASCKRSNYTGLHVKNCMGFFFRHFLIDFDVLKPKKIFTTFHHIRFFYNSNFYIFILSKILI